MRTGAKISARFMPVISVIIIGLIVWGIVALVRYTTITHKRTDSALEILKTRYASGEISKTEYEAKKKDLV